LKRRDFITLLGGAAAWPLAARAREPASVPKIGVLWPGASPPASPRLESFRRGLREQGYVEGRNVAIELRYAERGGPQQLPELAAELVSINVDVILASGDFAPKVAQQATATIPIIAFADDILGAGLVTNLSRPNGNAPAGINGLETYRCMAALVPVLRAADGTATTHIQSAGISQLARADEVIE
jgi:putative ABC transport system substrate-binding protein